MFAHCACAARNGRDIVGLSVKPVGKLDAGNPHVQFDERLLAAMRSPGLHELVAAEQLHMPVRLRRVESTSDLQDTELADILTSAFLKQPWYPWDIGSTLCSAEVETTDQLTPTLEGVGQKVKRTECLPLNDSADD